MVVCKFFLQGTCKFGDFCKFEHQLNDNFNSYQNSTSILRQSQFGHPQQQTKPATNPSNVDINTLVKSVVNDMTVGDRGGQWLLSCYAPYKEKPAFPGFEDQSFEEIRWGYYEALKNGTVEQYKQQVQIMLQQAIMKMKSLQSPSPDIVNMLKCIYDTPPSSYSGVYGSNTSTTTTAFNAPTNTSGSYGQTQPPFGQQPSASVFAPSNNNVFGNSTQTQNQFGNTSSNIFGGGSSQTQGFQGQTNNSIFGNTQPQAQNTTNIFRQANNAFAPQSGSSIFGGQSSMTTSGGSIFGSAQSNAGSTFGGAQPTGGSVFGTGQSNTGSIFGGQQTNSSIFSGQQNVAPTFASPPQPTSSNVFSNSFANQNTNTGFDQNSFATSPINQQSGTATTPQNMSQQTTSNIFRNANTQLQGESPQKSMFAQQPTSLFNQPNTGTVFNQQISNAPFSQSPLSAVDANSHSSSIFGSRQNTVVLNPAFSQVQPSDETVYSKLEELTEEEIKWFESDDLDVLKIPEKPPTYQMCLKT